MIKFIKALGLFFVRLFIYVGTSWNVARIVRTRTDRNTCGNCLKKKKKKKKLVIASLWPLVSFPQRIWRSFNQIKMETACGLRWKFPLVPSPSQKFDLDSQSVSVKCHLTAPFSPNERNTRLLPFHFIIFFVCVCSIWLLGGRNGNVSYPSRTSIARHMSSFALCCVPHL